MDVTQLQRLKPELGREMIRTAVDQQVTFQWVVGAQSCGYGFQKKATRPNHRNAFWCGGL